MQSIVEFLVKKHQETKPAIDSYGDGEITGVNFVIQTYGWPDSKFAWIRNLVKKFITIAKLDDKQKAFIEDFIADLKKATSIYKVDTYEIINGEKPKFRRAKCLYDILNYALEHEKEFALTIPLKNKINKLLRDDCSNSSTFDKLGWPEK